MSVFELMSQFQFVIIGGGPAGVELAGILRAYLRTLARIHEVPERFVTVNLLQGAPRLLPTMNEEVSRRALKRLDSLGINIILGKAVAGEDAIGVYLKDIGFSARTIIWTAGVKATSVYEKITGLTLEKNGRIVVNESMMAVGVRDVFVLGDSASTPFAGTAQTAIYDGEYIASALSCRLNKKNLPKYNPKPTPYVIPVGNNWAIFTFKNITLSGRIFFWLREIIDLRFFMSILPFQKAWFAWRSGGTQVESCPNCRH
jgi:NADH dehydrogenase